MTIYVFNDSQDDNLRKFAYESLVNDGVSRFFWSYKETFDLHVLADKASKDELDSEEAEIFKEQKFLLGIVPGDYVVHINVPEWGKVTVGKVESAYYFQKDLPGNQTDGRHCFRVKNVFRFTRDDPLVHPDVNQSLKGRGRFWRMSAELVGEFFENLFSLLYQSQRNC